MALMAGVNIPDSEHVDLALTRIYGIGPAVARAMLARAAISGNPRVRELKTEELGRLREIIDRSYKVEGDLRRELNSNIRRLIDIGAYRGVRHSRGLPCRGQRTRTNARTKRGSRRTVAGRRRTSMKK